MSNFVNLVKVNLKEMLSFKKKKNDNKTRNRLITIVILTLFLFAMSIIYNGIFIVSCYASNISVFYANIFMSIFLTFIIFSAGIVSINNIYIGKDYDLLKSMPINKKDIILSKTFSIYFMTVCYSFIVLFPNLVISFLFTRNLNYIFTVGFEIFLLPILPLVISGFFASFISYLSSYFKKLSTAINIIFQTLIYIVFFVFIFYFSFSISSDSSDEVNIIDVDIFDKLELLNALNYFLDKSIDNLLYLFPYLIINIILIIGFTFFISKMFYRIHDLLAGKKSNKVYVKKKYIKKSQFSAFFKNEIRRFFKTKTMLLNNILTGVMQILLAVLIIYLMKYSETQDGTFSFESYYSSYGYIAAGVIIYMGGMQVPSGYLISIEGKNISTIKSMPINYNIWLKAKVLLSILILSIFSLIASIISAIMLNTDFYSTIVLIIIPIFYDIFVSLIWLKVNLMHPKFNWNTEQQLMKNSLMSMLCVFIDLIISTGVIIALVALSFINRYLAGITIIAVMIIVVVIAYRVLFLHVRKNVNDMKLTN